MATFIYQALDKDTGEEIEGVIEADNQAKALKKIETKNLSPFKLEAKGEIALKESSFNLSFFNKKEENLILFTRQLANLLQAGVQLGEALEVISRLLKPGDFKEVTVNIHNLLKSGYDFAEALAKYPDYFSTGYINMIKAGEEGGFLDLTCQRLAQNIEDNSELKSFIVSSLIYPIILLVVSVLAIGIMITYVLPKFALIYENYGQALPISTRLLLQLSQFLSSYWLIIILGLAAAMIAIVVYYQSNPGKEKLDSYLLRIPILGKLITGITITKISRSMGSMLQSGVPLLKALRVSLHITNNCILKQALEKATLQVKRGEQLSETLKKRGVFPEIAVYMIGVGERTGNLGAMLLQVANNFEKDSKKTLEKLMKSFEPLMILIMGVIIGSIIVSMLLPILGINNISL